MNKNKSMKYWTIICNFTCCCALFTMFQINKEVYKITAQERANQNKKKDS